MGNSIEAGSGATRMMAAIRIGVRKGGGPPPGYQWNIGILDAAFHEAKKFLAAGQYEHLSSQVKELAAQEDPTHSDKVDVRPVDDIYEIRDRGGILRNLNVRVFFGVDHAVRSILVLGAIQKQNNGPTPMRARNRVLRRWRRYKQGDFGIFPI